jgi:hypothetical protein
MEQAWFCNNALKLVVSNEYEIMTQLTSIQVDDGFVIYIETTEDIAVNAFPIPDKVGSEEQEVTRGGEKGWGQGQFADSRNPKTPQVVALQSFKAIEGTIRAYTHYTLSAFQQVAIANIDKVTLEFGIEIGGEAGIPYVTKGTAKSNMKITVECSFPQHNT